jgi:hypothetical protein
MLDEILGFEGGFSDNPNDSGGATNYGVTQDTLNGWQEQNGGPTVTGVPQNVRDLTVGQARMLLQGTSYDDYQLDRIKDYDVAHHIFDMFVNTRAGPVRDFVYGAIDDVMRQQSLYDEHHAPLTDLPSKRVGPQGMGRIDWLVGHGYKTALQDTLVKRRRAYAERQPNYDKFPGLLPRIEGFRPPNHLPEGWYD